MGSSSSKASRAAGAAARQYPARPSPTSPSPAARPTNAPPRPPPPAPNRRPGPTVRPQPHASGTRDEAINLDASDPDFARSLRQLGAVQPNPTLSNSSTFAHPSNPHASFQRMGPDPRTNPAVAVLDARARLQDEAEKEFIEAGKRGHEGRQFLDVYTIRQILMLRDKSGVGGEEIERRLGLKEGVVERLGARGLFEITQNSEASVLRGRGGA